VARATWTTARWSSEPDLKALKGNPAEILQDPHMEAEPLHLLG